MIQVTKRDGTKEPLDLEKIHKVLQWACENITGVSVSEIELKSQVQFYNNIKTSSIHETLIKAAADLISEETPNYQYVAGRLVNYHIRKEVYGSYTPPRLYDHIKKVVEIGFYDREMFESYTEDEWDKIDSFINHDRDFLYTYAAIEVWRGKYLVKNRVTGEFYETPQVANALIAATLFSKYKDDRMKWVKEFYDALSTFDFSLPSPIMAGVRTPQRQFSSCVLIDCDDTLDSINATASAIVKYVSQRAGIGVNIGRLRAIGSPIRGGDVYHTGITPFVKYFQAAVSSCNQGNLRKGSATVYCPIWHLEIEDILVLKNSKGTEDNRARNLDYGIQFNRLMYERLVSGGNITLFSPHDVPDMYDAFFNDYDRFKELYEKAERSTKIRKKTIPAYELFSMFMEERKETGRIYLMNVDHANDHGPFKTPIYMSNLCAEIALATTPLSNVNDADGLIALCTLASVNWAKIKEPSDFEKPCTLIVRALDALLSYQSYPLEAGENSTRFYRPLGVGINNLAYWMAKNDMTYTNPDLDKIHEYAEAWSYYLIKASADLAEEYGVPEKADLVKYNDGILPIDTYKKDVDNLASPVYKMPWDELREQLKRTGIRNSTLMAIAPTETSSVLINATNGVEPPRSLVSIKQSKDGISPQVVPEFKKLKNKYELLWDQKTPRGYLSIMAVLQKFIDQSISTNTSYNPAHFESEEIPMSVLIEELLWAYKHGLKTLYYFNTMDGAGEYNDNTPLKPGEVIEDDCEGCKL